MNPTAMLFLCTWRILMKSFKYISLLLIFKASTFVLNSKLAQSTSDCPTIHLRIAAQVATLKITILVSQNYYLSKEHQIIQVNMITFCINKHLDGVFKYISQV